MAVEVRGEIEIQERHQTAKSLSPDEPLVIRSAGVMVRAIQAGPGNDLEQAMEERFVPDMHADGDGRLTAVSSETALTDQDTEEESHLQRARAGQFFGSLHSASRSCYTVW